MQITSKSITIGIIFLITCFSSAPCIIPCSATTVQTNETIELTSQVYGIKESKDTVVLLTTDQYQNLTHYLLEFRARLNQTTTQEDMTDLFKEAILELNTYGLIPNEMGIEQVYDLPAMKSRDSQITTLLLRMTRNAQFLNQTNALCLIAGEITMNTRFFGFLEMGSSALCWILYSSVLLSHHYSNNSVLFNNLLNFTQLIRNIVYKINAARVIGTGVITFGHSHSSMIPPPYRYDPAQGWITTIGLLGKKSWDSTFFGRILWMVPFNSESYMFYPGALGFIGIKLNLYDGTFFFFGSSLLVSAK